MTRRESPVQGLGVSSHASKRATAAIPGYEEIDLAPHPSVSFDGNAAEEVVKTRQQILAFIEARDPIALLAKSGEQLLREMVSGPPEGQGVSGLDQVHIEILQSFVLRASRGTRVPTSPKSIVRLWSLVQQNIKAYLAFSDPGPNISHDADLAHRVRLRTIFYRNIFSGDDAFEIVPALLAHMDNISNVRLGFKISDFVRALHSLLQDISDRFELHINREQVLRSGHEVDEAISSLTEKSAGAKRMWRLMGARLKTQGARGWAGFQLAEMQCTALFTFDRNNLIERFGVPITTTLFSCSLEVGSLSATEPDRVYLENPIWCRPFIALDADTLFLPLPVLMVSFPFSIVEGVIGKDERLLTAYSDARSRYVEDEAERIIRTSLPSAQVYRGVKWTDPDTGKNFENDIVAVVGMHVLIVEAKSGRLKPASRRGGVASLRKNFRELYVEPGEQAARLEMILARGSRSVGLTDRHGLEIQLHPSSPYVVHKFGICVEQFASITSSRRIFRDLGLLESNENWAPILTIGEMRMLSAHLDTETSFLHYLTRRSTIDDVLDFVADEQDLLAMYLRNRFIIDTSALVGHQVVFLNADASVRGRQEPRSVRTVFGIPGEKLTPMWRRIVAEIHGTPDRHCFDKLFTILNQEPSALAEVERCVRRWRSGGGRGKGNTLSCRAAVGSRVFVVSVHLAQDQSRSKETWKLNARTMALDLVNTFEATDCLLLLMTRRSSNLTFDAISFFRFSTH